MLKLEVRMDSERKFKSLIKNFDRTLCWVTLSLSLTVGAVNHQNELSVLGKCVSSCQAQIQFPAP